MKKTLVILFAFGLVLNLSGCDDKTKQEQAERKKKQERFKKPINAKSDNAPIKLPL